MRTTDTILTEYRSDTRHFERGARRYDRTLSKQERLTNDRLTRIDRRWERSTRSILASRTALVSLTGVVGGAALLQLRAYGEEWRNVERRLQSIGVTSEQSQQDLIDLAIRTRSSVAGTAAAVQRMAKSTGDGIEVTTRRVETLQKLLASGGASGTERASVSLQLGQALQSGVLSGDEFRSIRENAPVEFLDALATAAGVTRQELKKFAEDQKLTTDIVLRALDGLASTADQKFGQLAVSGEEAFSVLTSGLVAYAGRVDEALGATASINGALVFLGEYMAGAGEGAETMAAAIQVAGAVALTAAGSRGIGALNNAYRRSAQSSKVAADAARAEVVASRAAVTQSRVELDVANQRQRARYADLRLRAEQGRATKRAVSQAAAADRAQAKAATALAGAQARAAAASTAHAVAQRNLSFAVRATAAGMRALNGVMAFFGGPVGVAMIALVGTLTLMANRTSDLERLTQATTDRVGELSAAYAAANGNVDALRKNIASMSLADAITSADELGRLLDDARDSAANIFNQPMFQGLSRNNPELGGLVQQLIDGSLRADEFRKELNNLVEQGDVGFARLVKIFDPVVKPLLESADASEKANDILLVLNGTSEEAAAAMQRLGISLGEAGNSADHLADRASAAAKGIAGLVSQIPELQKAAKAQENLTAAIKNRDDALAGLGDPLGWGPEEAEEAARINDLYQQAAANITGIAEATKDAGKALGEYTESARIGGLSDRDQALAREAARYDDLVEKLRTAKRSQEELDAAEAAYQQRRAQINADFDERGQKGATGALRDRERDLAEARELLSDSGQRALYIEQELKRERERLTELMPELIALGLSRADAEKLIADQLEVTKERLGDVKSASEEAAETFASNLLRDIREADNLADAVDRIKDRLLDLATSSAFDKLAEQFAKLLDTGGGFDLLTDALGALLGGITGSGSSAPSGTPKKAATGGLIRGPGTSTSDSIPARLSDGEYVIRARSVTPETLPFLEAINRGVTLPAFAMGGQFGRGPGRARGVERGLSVAIYNAPEGEHQVRQTSDGGIEVILSAVAGEVDKQVYGPQGRRKMKQYYGVKPVVGGS